jgi:hypothetical protein
MARPLRYHYGRPKAMNTVAEKDRAHIEIPSTYDYGATGGVVAEVEVDGIDIMLLQERGRISFAMAAELGKWLVAAAAARDNRQATDSELYAWPVNMITGEPAKSWAPHGDW